MSNQHLAAGPHRHALDRSHGAVVIQGAPWKLHYSFNRWVRITLAWSRKRIGAPSVTVTLRQARRA